MLWEPVFLPELQPSHISPLMLKICLVLFTKNCFLEFLSGNTTALPPNQLLFQMQSKQVNMHKQPIWMEIACASDLRAHRSDALTKITEIISVPQQFTFLTVGF